MTPLSEIICRLESKLAERIKPLSDPYPRFTIFLSVTDGSHRANVFHASSDTFHSAWNQVANDCLKELGGSHRGTVWVRADWVTDVQALRMAQLRDCLKTFKRNYFRFGLAFDRDFEVAFLEQELNANAMLYGGMRYSHAILNERNIHSYARKRFGERSLPLEDEAPVYMFTSSAVFSDKDGDTQWLHAAGLNSGRRQIESLDETRLYSLIDSGSHYLSSQVGENGRFQYGWHPCFDRPIKTYNALRHASTLYAMLESWEITSNPDLLASIERGVSYVLDQLIQVVTLESGATAAFVIDAQDEIKLGANAVCILMLTKYTELTGTTDYLEILGFLAEGILFMRAPETGGFVHVLHYPSLQVKDRFRVIYYNGEAAFALMRLFKLTGERRWLHAVEQAFEYFIAQKFWRYHDHWLSYCVNELTLYCPRERYFHFGILNVADYLDFVEKRVTTFPTLLELMMAAQAMIERLKASSEHRHLLDGLDLEQFERALKTRAHHLLNGHFWPEFAMFFQNPEKIVGSFFIRHQAFRVRIDDVEHYLSGYVAYLKALREGVACRTQHQSIQPDATVRIDVPHFSKLPNFKIDIKRLRTQFVESIAPLGAGFYTEAKPGYRGWAVSSLDGSMYSGIAHREQVFHGGYDGPLLNTEVCQGYLAGLLTALKLYGISTRRVRIMSLEAGEADMPFHSDQDPVNWRVHVPIITSQGSRFEWLKMNGDIESVHLPADGSAWLVRVDSDHRVIVRDQPDGPRVHLVIELGSAPAPHMFANS